MNRTKDRTMDPLRGAAAQLAATAEEVSGTANRDWATPLPAHGSIVRITRR
jgi:hypothetical protein